MPALFFGLLAVYAALATLYAFLTPTWQAPDEPAHYNYVRYVAESGGLPVLRLGDYDFAYLERLKEERFPPQLSIDPLRYEFHQPPLYYFLAAPVFLLTRGLAMGAQVVALRLFSVALGILLLCLTYATVRRLFPESPLLSLAVPALIATVPQHIAGTAAVSNDTLAEVLLTAILLVQVLWWRAQEEWDLPRAGLASWAHPLLLGVLLGLGLLTKTTVYVAVPLLVGTTLLPGLGAASRPFSRRALELAAILAIALGYSGWWFRRNALVYGGLDIFGLLRHDQVVVGQPTTGALSPGVAVHFLATTFRSFWAQFGWMGVPAPEGVYALLVALVIVALVGLALFGWRAAQSRPSLSPLTSRALLLFAATLALVALGMAQYNLRYIQAQGRYLFPAILPIATFLALGVHELVAERYRVLAFALLYLILLALDLYALFGMIVPFL